MQFWHVRLPFPSTPDYVYISARRLTDGINWPGKKHVFAFVYNNIIMSSGKECVGVELGNMLYGCQLGISRFRIILSNWACILLQSTSIWDESYWVARRQAKRMPIPFQSMFLVVVVVGNLKSLSNISIYLRINIFFMYLFFHFSLSLSPLFQHRKSISCHIQVNISKWDDRQEIEKRYAGMLHKSGSMRRNTRINPERRKGRERERELSELNKFAQMFLFLPRTSKVFDWIRIFFSLFFSTGKRLIF